MNNIAIIIGNISNHAGTERAVTNLANLLVKSNKYNISIISMYSKNGDKCYYDINKSIIIHHLNLSNKNKIARLLNYLIFLRKVNRIINFNNIECIIGTTHAINSLISNYRKKVKTIGCEHMSYNACPPISRHIRKILYKKLDSVVVLTNADAKHYSFIQKDKLYVIPNSVSFECDYSSTLENKRMIAVGRLTYQKGYDILINIAKQIKNECPEWTIDIFGDGEDKENLLKLISENELNNYIHIKNPTQNIQNELLNSSLYLMTSRFEGLPMVLIEAQVCGLPIVSFNCPEGPADVVSDNANGYLVTMNNRDEYANKVIALCKNINLRKEFGRIAKESAKKYSTERIYEKWVELFNSLK